MPDIRFVDQGIVPDCFGSNQYNRVEHKFPKWDKHVERGISVVTSGERAGHVEYFVREWQTRVCETCGFEQKV